MKGRPVVGWSTPWGRLHFNTPLVVGGVKVKPGRDGARLNPTHQSGNKGRWRAESLIIKMFQSGTCMWWHISLTRSHFTLYRVFFKAGSRGPRGKGK